MSHRNLLSQLKEGKKKGGTHLFANKDEREIVIPLILTTLILSNAGCLKSANKYVSTSLTTTK